MKIFAAISAFIGGGFGLKKLFGILNTVRKLLAFRGKLTKEVREAIKESKDVYEAVEHGYADLRGAVANKDITIEEAKQVIASAYLTIKEVREAGKEINDVITVLKEAVDTIKD